MDNPEGKVTYLHRMVQTAGLPTSSGISRKEMRCVFILLLLYKAHSCALYLSYLVFQVEYTILAVKRPPIYMKFYRFTAYVRTHSAGILRGLTP